MEFTDEFSPSFHSHKVIGKHIFEEGNPHLNINLALVILTNQL